jgi:cobalt/nickel transport system permease protein
MHIHIPDGVFPVWLWLSSIVLLAPLLVLAIALVRKDQKRLVMTSALTALMLIIFSIEVAGFHLNFTALSGMLLGPWWSLISITVVNTILSLFGHGGITVAPINILINWVESLIGYAIFWSVMQRTKDPSLKSFISAASVLVALAASFCLFLLVISLTGINPAQALEGAALEYVPLWQFAMISMIPTVVGAAIEAVLTLFVVRFILKAKPGLLK